MHDMPINYLALIFAAFARVIIAAFLFSPPVFGRLWLSANGKTLEEMRRKGGMALTAHMLGSLVTAWILGHAIVYGGATTIGEAILIAFGCWLGFIFAGQLPVQLWLGRSLKALFAVQSVVLITYLAMSVIIFVWP
jgi:hypothetical protein